MLFPTPAPASTISRMGWILSLLFLCCSCCTSALGHLGSLANGEVKSPVLPYSRVARDPGVNTQYYDGGDENSRYANFRPPSFQHKFPQGQGRLSKFHHTNGRERDGQGQALPIIKPQIFGNGRFQDLLNKINNPGANSGEQQQHEMDNDELPTFTPYIGARALSNMKEFFEHLQENINALRKDEGDEEGNGEYVGSGSNENGSGNSEQNYGFGSDVKELPSINFRSEWKPHALGDHGLKKIRSFLPFINQESTRTRLGTNLGLGRRRR